MEDNGIYKQTFGIKFPLFAARTCRPAGIDFYLNAAVALDNKTGITSDNHYY